VLCRELRPEHSLPPGAESAIPLKSRSLVGVAGTYFVSAELAQKGYIATLTTRNTEAIDILASNPDGSKTVSIQVKASAPEQREHFSRSWIMGEKHETAYSPNFYYVFVDLKPTNEKPDFYVVPSETVANYVKTSHSNWLKRPSKTGKPHRDNPMRLFEIEDKDTAKYLNR
jgi:hypothetical protein